MLHTAAFYTACAIFLIGIGLRSYRWLSITIGPETWDSSPGSRFWDGLRQALKTIGHRSVSALLRALVIDVLLQGPLFRRSRTRWLLHLGIFIGCLYLIFLHALGNVVTDRLFPAYQSTLNPFLLLRTIFGLLALAGVFFALLRRCFSKTSRFFSNRSDLFAPALLAMILLSGFLLESSKLVSEPIFDQMVEDYLGDDDPAVVDPLRAYWARQYGVVFEESIPAPAPDLLAAGKATHLEACADCHAPASAAFIGRAGAWALEPVAPTLNRARADRWLWHFHYLLAFAALALLPFSKFFHLLATPINLLARAAGEPAAIASLANRRGLALDACTHCGLCSEHCSVAPVYRVIGNATILPSEKLLALKRRHRPGRRNSDCHDLAILAEGSFICTECRRCTDICPSGIQLQDLWLAGKHDLRQAGYPEWHLRMDHHSAGEWADPARLPQPRMEAKDTGLPHHVRLADQRDRFSGCVQCTVCTSVCPVVAIADDPAKELDLTPQQVMNLLRLGLKDTALGVRMVWKCVTCYLCQEHCPQGVKVADVLYELRNLSYDRFRDSPQGECEVVPASRQGLADTNEDEP